MSTPPRSNRIALERDLRAQLIAKAASAAPDPQALIARLDRSEDRNRTRTKAILVPVGVAVASAALVAGGLILTQPWGPGDTDDDRSAVAPPPGSSGTTSPVPLQVTFYGPRRERQIEITPSRPFTRGAAFVLQQRDGNAWSPTHLLISARSRSGAPRVVEWAQRTSAQIEDYAVLAQSPQYAVLPQELPRGRFRICAKSGADITRACGPVESGE